MNKHWAHKTETGGWRSGTEETSFKKWLKRSAYDVIGGLVILVAALLVSAMLFWLDYLTDGALLGENNHEWSD
ncbi:hypothetical protein [Mesorhizobium sp. M8A.F.Ca.ET.165.01.1.1]|uniref:hypothetical protein n=1 Tax=Mesorhizobium sp. M8A.F.Ca.ET.165.01.1.1 TaxID=2563960 RepID=UPI001093C6CE|nr:hypothetical protein [Mesorhizobium sp. M8A.F.Ca.ET.165.01.1.1]TGT42770.1 hypothetical protein EN808_12880 [Mesorhizobium sp. M8A.F.Ca.ET.165.01.1.1]